MSVANRPGWLRYGAAVLAVVLAVALTRLPAVGQFLGVLFFLAVFVSAWYGGLGPGLLAISLPMAAIFAGLAAARRPPAPQQATGLAVFLGGGLLITTLVEALHVARRKAEQSMAEAQRHQQRLRDADRLKDEFLAMLAHELRNPLAAIGGALQLLRRQGWPGPGDERGWSLDVLERQSAHLARLIDDLLDVSRVSRGKIRLRRERLDARLVLERAAEAVRVPAVERRHELRLALPEEPLWLEADPTRLEQVLVNLLGNAVKYTEPGGRIDLSAERVGADWVFRVRDTGAGIDPEMLPHIFDPFIQADKTLDRSQGGLGIGLTLVHRLVALHGGHVSATSDGLGQGSEFAVHLPASAPPLGAVPRPLLLSAPPTPTRPLRVLVVDDNTDTAKSLTRLLRLSGHEAYVAHDGPSALDLAREERPEVFLIDIGLPGMTGYELAQHLRREGFASATLIAISGYGQEQDIQRSRDAGIDHHLVKPIDFDSLLALVARAHPEREPGPRLLASSHWREQRV
ncbi:MAG: ATP-binding protein [Isosphaeraceae bacterium]|nr:ATP-binding protein [Isosphaeraceae bacterium]